MEIKTTEQIRYEFTKLQYTPKDKWVKVDDIKRYLEHYKIDVDDYHSSDYFVKKFIDELERR